MKIIRKIFFYVGQDKYFVMEMLQNYDFFPHIGIRNLLDNSLTTISNNKLCMHKLLQQINGLENFLARVRLKTMAKVVG